MKKFLSICLVALCSVSAMYAQETPTTEANLNNVECGSTVTVSATAASEHFHFHYWMITGFDNGNGTTSERIDKGGSSNIFNATSSSTTTGQNNVEQENLTVTINSNLINWVNTPGAIGTLTFEAFFTEDPKSKITIIAVDEAGNTLDVNDYQIVSNLPANDYVGENVTLEVDNKNGSCYVFHHWAETPTGQSIGNNKTYSATYVSEDKTYYAVYTNKVNIKVKTANSSIGMGTVTVSLTNQQ